MLFLALLLMVFSSTMVFVDCLFLELGITTMIQKLLTRREYVAEALIVLFLYGYFFFMQSGGSIGGGFVLLVGNILALDYSTSLTANLAAGFKFFLFHLIEEGKECCSLFLSKLHSLGIEVMLVLAELFPPFFTHFFAIILIVLCNGNN